MQSTAQKIEEFNGLQKLAYDVLTKDKRARFSKQVLVHSMWMYDKRTSDELTFKAFATDLLNDKFKVESYTRAARKVVEKRPELGNPDRHKLAEQMKVVIRESDVDPGQIEIDFGGESC